MTSSSNEKSPLARLVLFIFCLAIAGSIVAGAYYYAVDLPQQVNVKAPLNSGSMNDVCRVQHQECIEVCNGLFLPSDRWDCIHSCGMAANVCIANPPGDDL